MLLYGFRFQGLPREAFAVFSLSNREERRAAIVAAFHPALELLGQDLKEWLDPHASVPLHAHLPRLDWPPGYQPFCTWLALSRESHGYQAGPQLGLGVHADSVSIRLGWDTGADAFGRFEFLCRHGEVGPELVTIAASHDLRFRVFASAPWPSGSELCFESGHDLAGSFAEVRRRGVWWEVSRRHAIPERLDHVSSPALGEESAHLLQALVGVYDRVAGGGPELQGD
jgi:hypothetical protein